MTRADFLARFPHASEACIRANCVDAVTRQPVAVPAAVAGIREPARVSTATATNKPAKGKRKRHTSHERPDHSAALATASDTFNRAQADYLRGLAELERDLRDGPLAAGQAQGVHCGKFLVRVTSFRRRLLDEDNLCEKYVVDCCRYSGLLPGDDPGQAHIVTTQEKVRRKDEERTEVVISRWVKN